MAEYINKEQLDRKFIIKMLSPTTNTIFDAKDIIDSLPTSDVIERTEFEKVVKSFKTMVEMKNENLIDMRDKYYALEKGYTELKVNIDKAIEEIEKIDLIVHDGTNHYYKDGEEVIAEVLEILKRNIGE